MAYEEIKRLHAKRELLQEELTDKKHELRQLRIEKRITAEVREIINYVAQETQEQVVTVLSELVTDALSVLDEPYTFQIDFVKSRGKTEARLILMKNGIEHKLFFGSGGGVADIVSFSLRLTFWSLKGDLQPVFIFDEPFKDLSKKYQEPIRHFMESFSEKYNAQFIVVAAHGKKWDLRGNIIYKG